MQGKRIILLPALALLFIIQSCGFNGESYKIGDDFIDSNVNMAVIDTFMVNLSTVIPDSIPTSGNDIILVGSYYDNELGQVFSESYFEMLAPSSRNVQEDDTYDSLTIVLKYKDWGHSPAYGDTLKTQQIHVYALAEELKTDEETGYLFNTSIIKTEDSPLGSITFLPYPIMDDSIEFRLSDELGRDLFQKMLDNDQIYSNSEIFREYFMGLALKPGDQSNSILSFGGDSLLYLRLHSSRHGQINEEIVNTFNITKTTTTQYNRIWAERAGTLIENIVMGEAIPSEETDSKSFTQSGTGIFTRVDFPTMQDILGYNRRFILQKAELILYPRPDSYMDLEILPDSLVTFYTDKWNRIVSEITDDNNYVFPAKLTIDDITHRDTRYVFDITSFVQNEINNGYFNPDRGLLIGESSTVFAKSLKRAVLSGERGSTFTPKVRLYFFFYNI